MSLDGAYLSLLRQEFIDNGLIGSRVDKIHQPSKEELIISLRALGGTKKLLFSAANSGARVNLTSLSPENPASPPMLCMLMRKHLGNGRLLAIEQDGFERILRFDFECMSEIGDMVTNSLIIEIMGRHSNIILTSGGKVIDSVKRITDDISSVRRILPGVAYELPPRQKRLNLSSCTAQEVKQALDDCTEERLSKALMAVFEGISPILAREWIYYICHNTELAKPELTADGFDKLMFFINRIRKAFAGDTCFSLACEQSGKPKDFTFVDILQYGTEMTVSHEEGASSLLEKFYSSSTQKERLKQRSHVLLKMLMNLYERTERRINIQKQELAQTADRDKLRHIGDLLNANIYRLEKGQNKAVLEDYETGNAVEIPLDVRLSPAQNAQKYYSEYRKLDTAEKMLTRLIADGEQELVYIDSVFDAASRTEGESELLEIRAELASQGYLRQNKKGGKTNKSLKPQPPIKYKSTSGFEILVGRNNKQNDELTLKTARADDIWLHTQNIPGSHVIIRTEGKKADEKALKEAAIIAAYNSKARESAQVPVDYTLVKYVKKPSGAKPGMVIFTNNKTLFVKPDEVVSNSLKINLKRS